MPNAHIYLLDCDHTLRQLVTGLIDPSIGTVECFDDPTRFLHGLGHGSNSARCAIVDYAMQAEAGVEFLDRLEAAGKHLPTVFSIPRADVPQMKGAFARGAVTVLEKPARAEEVLAAVDAALLAAFEEFESRGRRARWFTLAESTSDGERRILPLLLEGKSPKQLARDLGTPYPTVARHRTRLLRHFGVENEIELLRLKHLMTGDI